MAYLGKQWLVYPVYCRRVWDLWEVSGGLAAGAVQGWKDYMMCMVSGYETADEPNCAVRCADLSLIASVMVVLAATVLESFLVLYLHPSHYAVRCPGLKLVAPLSVVLTMP